MIFSFLILFTDSQDHTPTLFTNETFEFSESARSEIVGITRDVLDKWVNWTISCPAKHSKCNEYFCVRENVCSQKYIIFFGNIEE
jgi:hypothetical protein